MKPLRIYVAGPYCPMDCSLHQASQQAQRNVDKAIEIGNRLIEKGHYVFIPHLSHYIHTHGSCHKDYGDWWYKEDDTFLDFWANALFYIASSKGADKELAKARNKNMRIFTSLKDVPRGDGYCAKFCCTRGGVYCTRWCIHQLTAEVKVTPNE